MEKLSNFTVLKLQEASDLLKVNKDTLNRQSTNNIVFSIKINSLRFFIEEDLLGQTEEEIEVEEEIYTSKELAILFHTNYRFILNNSDFFDKFAINKKAKHKRYSKLKILNYINKEREKQEKLYDNKNVNIKKKEIFSKQKKKTLSTKDIAKLINAA